MALVCADHANHAFTADDLAVAADFLDRSRNSHFILLKLCIRFTLPTWTLPVTVKELRALILACYGISFQRFSGKNGLHISVT
jgi:hypothetical protein